MADVNTIKNVLSLIATKSSTIKDLTIKNGQLIFVQDLGRIAFDFNGVRKFYNQITELETEQERVNLDPPTFGYYFVIETGVLWLYRNEWIQITSKPEEIIFVGTELPQLGQENKIYATTTEGNENISVWDEESSSYKVVADKTHSITNEEVIAMFNNK